ncbi:MAG TPA: signal peptidase I [bacterium]|nr:signal peptidase I [bacterium]HOL46596.1 signal peptidase I [bacterium]HPQ17833.1 signal peptidase I [bacterium]
MKKKNFLYYLFYPILIILEWLLVPKNSRAKVRDGFETLFVAFFMAMVLRAYVLQAFYIPSSSMESTLLIGDHLIANKVIFKLFKPERYDIVIFQYPEDKEFPEPEYNYIKLAGAIFWNKTEKNFFKKFHYYMPKDFIKRCIGLPGDVVEVTVKNNQKIVLINSEKEKFDGFQHISNQFEPIRDYFGPVRVPAKNSVFKLSDCNIYELFFISQYFSFYNKNFKFDYNVYLNNELVDYITLPNGYNLSFKEQKLFNLMYYYQACKLFNIDIHIKFFNFFLDDKKIEEVKFSEDCYFVLGDNRDNSKDSRFWGVLPENFLKGTALFNYWPVNRIKLIK